MVIVNRSSYGLYEHEAGLAPNMLGHKHKVIDCAAFKNNIRIGFCLFEKQHKNTSQCENCTNLKLINTLRLINFDFKLSSLSGENPTICSPSR